MKKIQYYRLSLLKSEKKLNLLHVQFYIEFKKKPYLSYQLLVVKP